ncbi:hypothetical protein ACWDWO_25850 [Actinopolymorpha singaporensis]
MTIAGSQNDHSRRLPHQQSFDAAAFVPRSTELSGPARLRPVPQVVRGRAFAGEIQVTAVEYRIEEGSWQKASLAPPEIPGARVRWQFSWDPEPGDHTIRVRATDDQGHTQPDTVPWNDLGYCYHPVLSHPIRVESTT